MKLKDLTGHKRNPRKITDEKLAMLKKGLDEFGDLGCIVMNMETGNLIGGHQRLKVLPPDSEIVITQRYDQPTRTGTIAEGHVVIAGEKFKYREVKFDENKEKAAMIAANKMGGEWEFPVLNELMLELDQSNYDMDLTGFDDIEIEEQMTYVSGHDRALPGEEEEDEVPEINAVIPPKTKLGDMYQLGRHRLMCGDSTSIDAVEKLMNGEKADMVFTDPPYNIAYEGGSKKRQMIKNDDIADFYQFLLNMYKCAFLATTPGAAIYVSHADTERVNFTKAFVDAGFHLSSVIIWKKNNSTFGRQDYFWKHEPILYGWNGSGAHQWYGPNTEDTVWEIDRPSRSEEHPTMKPIPLIERALNNSSKHGNKVLDLFGGSGSTLIACEKTNRCCFMMELDPHYCDVIVARWEKYTGKKAQLISSNDNRDLVGQDG